MTVTTQIFGYLEAGYLEGPYLTNTALASAGMQANIIIETQTARGMQSQIVIADQLYPVGMQAQITIQNYLNQIAMQASVTIAAATKTVGMQAMANILDFYDSNGMQANVNILDYLRNMGFEARIDKYPTGVCQDSGYLGDEYLVFPYLTEIFCTRPGMQAHINILNFNDANGMQSKIQILDYLKPVGMQAKITIQNYLKPIGFQADVVRSSAYGMQALATIYNTTNLRILCDFPSRGLTASNWTSNSTMGGDFSVQNLDTDVVEQVWRSNNILTGVQLKTDTGLPQGVFLDTLAILNHNLTRSAVVTLLGSNDPTFAVIGVTIPLEPRLTNIFYIAPTLPTSGYRYWRLDIDDVTNAASYLEVGTIIFGAADIFQGECFVDEIEFELKDYADTVRTEGFTNVANSRTQKRRLKLDFRSLDFNQRNFTIIRDMFERDRTINKCLWIPTPSDTRQDITARFAAFGKLSVIPTERHNNKGPDNDYVTFTCEVDESL
jgi:hypothetical protein